MKKSNLDVAFELISKKKRSVDFLKLWADVSSIQGMSEEEANQRVGQFLTQLSLDGRFISLSNNTWNLRERYAFSKIDAAITKNIIEETDNYSSDDDSYIDDDDDENRSNEDDQNESEEY